MFHSIRSALRSSSWTLAAFVGFALATAASPASAVDLSGCWSGCWKSCVTGHQGPLRASFIRCNDQQYDVTFTGRFFKLFPFRFTVTLDVIEDKDGQIQLSGDSYLGRLFGTFHYDAAATETDFRADYSTCKDNGYFKLSRCGDCGSGGK